MRLQKEVCLLEWKGLGVRDLGFSLSLAPAGSFTSDVTELSTLTSPVWIILTQDYEDGKMDM